MYIYIYASVNYAVTSGATGSGNDLSIFRGQAIIWTNDDLLIGPVGTNCNEM